MKQLHFKMITVVNSVLLTFAFKIVFVCLR